LLPTIFFDMCFWIFSRYITKYMFIPPCLLPWKINQDLLINRYMYYKMHSKPLGCCWEKNLQILTIKISEVMWLLCHTSLGKFLPNMVKVCSVVLKQMKIFPIEFLCKSWPLLSVIFDRHQSTNIDDRNINIKFPFTLSMVPTPDWSTRKTLSSFMFVDESTKTTIMCIFL
jgi:hypothetical protein